MEKSKINGIRVIPTEDEEQIWLFSWAELNMGRYPELRWMHHIPNGGKRSKSEAARFKAMGVKAGVSDVFLPVARGEYHGLYVEMKARDGRTSKAQEEFLDAVRKQGYAGCVAYSGEEAARMIVEYLEGVCI